ncbi:MAG: 4-hydroxy-tetrahydrodipicolinate reductase [Epsilonproteobacteria bacterium]|nr:4-hydroxy-tetrahydrodipicolinate reductase [Campylobacterota bacterium]OIO17915.1 MAG: 4-hydroxy-tetrahydrodipicolinate reductase [Helicobacteraceae bacterium CG1_02_36_14]PIP09321.1 MAG: 4-hydroxy-tetrahydrodipicolinate reductase [Sulfurimonas sp. CG23_combo_of_CG06-09_8_20_14_all_36_33]PIS24374.1 MAG: 4-hydroxy-tetrahydrodipicolinate reductase [Sulfurimonas sp. CG08_land_8_20_14_0_20_36_33]PIU34459.1 MAG: 4-hydroxy-tetrahydrodipicolinate reductase [Sulfurimonas sp. CG07_land_8_20_14_0_80_3
MIKVGVFGASGRVGKLLLEDLKNTSDMSLSAVYVRNNLDFSIDPSVLVTADMKSFLNASDVIIDFSLPDACETLLEVAVKVPKPLVIGTTGLNTHQINLLKDASELMPILYATNMSLGVALLNKLVFQASATLKEFDIEIVEMHHKHKKDAPSGTALTLSESAAKGRDLDINSVRVSGRDGNIGERTKDEIAVMALRGGDIVGRHTVGFYNDGEFLELNHTATSRNTFSKGAIRAAHWLADKENGLYSISDCLEL